MNGAPLTGRQKRRAHDLVSMSVQAGRVYAQYETDLEVLKEAIRLEMAKGGRHRITMKQSLKSALAKMEADLEKSRMRREMGR